MSAAGLEQIEPLAQLADRWHELATQIQYLATRELDGGFGPDVLATAHDSEGNHLLGLAALALYRDANYPRSCASSIIATAVSNANLNPRSAVEDRDRQEWIALTTRPLASTVRPTLVQTATADDLASQLRNLDDEILDAMDKLGDVFEALDWSRTMATSSSEAVEYIRERLTRLS